MLERSGDGINFTVLSNVSAKWPSINGEHIYTDVTPIAGQ